MATGIDPNKIDRYVLEADRKLPEEKRTVFLLKSLRHSKKVAMFSDIKLEKRVIDGEEVEIPERPVEYVTGLVRSSLCGWENFKTAEGEEIPFALDSDGGYAKDDRKASDDSMTALTFDQINELSERVLGLSGLAGTQGKK